MHRASWVRWSSSAALALAILAGAPAHAFQFTIASSPQPEVAAGVASDGTDFLVGILGDANGPTSVGAQLVSSSGALLGGLIPTFHTGAAPLVAFGGGQYLLAWTDNALFPDNDIWGMFVSPSGVAGATFPLSASAFDEELDGLGFDGTNFFVVYEADQNGPTGRYMKGRFVDSAGVVGVPVTISSQPGVNGFDCVAFGGGKYLVAWNDDSTNLDVRARSVTTAGVLGTEFLVSHATVPQGDQVAVVTDGTDFLVVWTREVGGAGAMDWDVIAQRATAAAVVGAEIAVADWARGQVAAFVEFDGSDYLIAWTDTSNDVDGDATCDPGESTCWDVAARFLSATGTLAVAPFGIVHDAGDQLGAPLAWNGTNYLVAWCDAGLAAPVGDVYGKLISPAAIQPPAVYCTPKVNSSACTPLTTWTGTPRVGNPAPFTIGAINELANKNGLLFYSTVGAQALAFQGGFLCVRPPIKRTAIQNSGGTPPCGGAYGFDFNAFIASGQDPALVVGRTVWAQTWSRDPGFAPPNNTGLTNGLAFTIGP